MFRIPLLQRYIFGEILRVFLFVLSCITVLLVFVGVFQQATDRGLSPEDVLKILPYVVPSMLPFTIPAALLLTISVVYGRIAGDQEFTAAKAAGIHPRSLMWPALFLGGTLSVFSLVLTDQVIPWSVGKIEQHIAAVMEDILLDQLRSELQFTDPSHRFHVTVSGVQDRTLMNPVIRYVRNRSFVTLRAEQAEIDLNLERREVVVKMRSVYVDLGPKGGSTYLNREYVERLRWDGSTDEQKARNLPISMLTQSIARIRSDQVELKQRQAIEALMALTTADFRKLGVPSKSNMTVEQMLDRYRKLRTEVHSRYALACSCFFFSLLGTPVSILYGKSQFLTSFLICFVPIVGIYYPFMLGLMTQSKLGNLEPSWGMWIANVALVIAGWTFSRKVMRY